MDYHITEKDLKPWNTMYKWLLFLFITSLHVLDAKCLIITHIYNRPDFVELQVLTLNKFLQEEYELVVFNDAEPGPMHDAINRMCNKWKIRSIPIPQEIHAHFYPVTVPPEEFATIPSGRHADAIRYSLETLGFDHPDVVVLLDSDLFLIRPFQFTKLVENHEIAAITSPGFILNEGMRILEGKNYLWPGLTIMNMPKLPDKRSLSFTPRRYSNFDTDTGGSSYIYLQEHPEVRLLSLDRFHGGLHTFYKKVRIHHRIPRNQIVAAFKHLGFNYHEMEFLLSMPQDIAVEFGVNNHVMHYRGAAYETSWGGRSEEYVVRKTALVTNFLRKICQD